MSQTINACIPKEAAAKRRKTTHNGPELVPAGHYVLHLATLDPCRISREFGIPIYSVDWEAKPYPGPHDAFLGDISVLDLRMLV